MSSSRSGDLTRSLFAAAAAVVMASANCRAGDAGTGLTAADDPLDDGLCGSDDDVCAAATGGH